MFESYAEELGLNLDQFKTDIKSKDVKNKVDNDRDYGREMGVSSTPSFYINGQNITNPRGLEPFRALIQGAIEKAKTEQAKEETVVHADVIVSIEGEEIDMSEIESEVLVGDSKVFSVESGTTLASVFEDMNMKLTEEWLTSADEIEYCQSDDLEFVIMVNGESPDEGPDYVIKDLDRILVLVGSETEEEIATLTETVGEEACEFSKNCSKDE